MKKCSKCKKFKKFSEFSKDRTNKKDSFQRKCKKCVKNHYQENKEEIRRKQKIYYIKNKNRIILKQKEYCNSKEGRKTIKNYQKKHFKTDQWKETNKKAVEKYIKKFPSKKKSHTILNHAIRDKKIIKPKFCSICDKTDCIIEGHHEDYSKPLEVIWCCSQCHRDLHKKLRSQLANS